jgi:hypothetical protein
VSAYVYLLWHKSEARFQIGTMDHLSARPVNVELSQFDNARTKALCLADYAMAKNAEQAMHRLFQRYRILPGEEATRQYPALAEGDAEWFSAECWGRLHTFIEDNEDLLDCRWLAQPDVQALFVPVVTRAEGLRDPFEGFTRELETQNDIHDTVKRAGDVLTAIARACRFVAVVQTADGYQMVGEAPVQRASFLRQGFELLFPLLNDGHAAADTKEGHYFAVSMRGAPGQSADEAANYEAWRERLVWAEKPQMPGFDVPLQAGEAQQARRILRDVLGVVTLSGSRAAPGLAL